MKESAINLITIFLAELLGTAMLVFLGCMGCIDNAMFPNNHLRIVINFGLVVMVVIQCFGCVSGAHINPSVTLAAFVCKKISAFTGLIYFTAQMVGGFIGYGLLQVIMPSDAVNPGLCVTIPHEKVNDFQAVGIEMVITGVLALVCCAVWDPRNEKYHDSVTIRFGLTITCLACTAGPFTGGSMNPARSFAPALLNNNFKKHWVYWVGPLLGSAICSLIYRFVFARAVNEKGRRPEEQPLS